MTDASCGAYRRAGETTYPVFETRRWTRREYDRLIDLGILDEDDPIELVQGHLVVREPQSSPHATATVLAHDALRRVFGRGWQVRMGLPLALGQDWIVTLVDRVVEVHREPSPGRDRRGKYRVVTIRHPGEIIRPLAAPSARVAVDDLLP